MSEDARATPSAGADSRVGQVLDSRYRILELLGTGGMGRVYRAEHVHIRREVAVKLLHAHLVAHESVGERFAREAVAIGKLDHPNCVHVQDFGRTDDGQLYLVMELLDGTPLDAMISTERPLPWQRMFHIARHVLRGLGHAHRAGIVHRDIKPENVVVIERDGDPDFAKILDFGIAKMLRGDGARELTEAGTTFGTPTYMSPEQAYGKAVDGRADLYALSIVMYELITGHVPFKAEDKLAVLAMHTSKPVPPLSERAPGLDVPAAAEEVVRRGLAKDRDARYPNAAAFIAAIDAVLAGAPLPEPTPIATATRTYESVPVIYVPAHGAQTPSAAQPTLAPASPSRWRRRGLLGLAVAAVSGAAVAALLLSGGPSQQARTAAELREAGDPKAAIRYLESQGNDLEGDVDAQLQLAHAYIAAERGEDAIAAFERVLALAPRQWEAAPVREAVDQLVASKDDEVAVRAASLVLGHGAHEGAAEVVIRAASSNRRLETRQRARKAAETAGILERINQLDSYALDLRQGKTCEQRKRAVQALRELRDPRAITALKRARFKGGGSRFDRSNRNACLKADAEAAIAELEALRK